jgi:hypothetical protein
MEPTEDTDMHDRSVSCAVDLISTLCAATTPLGETLGMSSKLSSSQTYTSRQNSGLICERRKLELVPCAELHIAWQSAPSTGRDNAEGRVSIARIR